MAEVAEGGATAAWQARFGPEVQYQETADGIPNLWVPRERLAAVMGQLKADYPMLFDLSAADERLREHRQGLPDADFTVFYHLISLNRNEDLRIKVPLAEGDAQVPSLTGLWPAANWYEREAYDMFGIRFDGHPNLYRILTPPLWEGHPLQKKSSGPGHGDGPVPHDRRTPGSGAGELAVRAGRVGHVPAVQAHGLHVPEPRAESSQRAWGVPHRLAARRRADRGRGAGHRLPPSRRRKDGRAPILAHLHSLHGPGGLSGRRDEQPALRHGRGADGRHPSAGPGQGDPHHGGRAVPHLPATWCVFGTFAQDVGQMSPVFYMFADRERLFSIVEAITGGRMHPAWFRIGGVTQDLPEGWDGMVRDFLDYMPARLDHYDRMATRNSILKKRTQGIGQYDTAEAVEWGVTGPGLRATGCDWDLRKKRPYGGYEQFDFEVPIAHSGDCYDRCVVRVEEIRQSLRIIRQCLDNMPAGPCKADHPQATPPPKERAMEHIETLIQHFLNVSWGPVVPPSECCVNIEATKGWNSYYLISDGGTASYRTRIRTPSFPHLQMIPMISRGFMVADLIAIIASIDFVMADVDR